MPNLNVSDIRPFIPAKDFRIAKQFYAALGCEVKDVEARMALVKFGARHFYIQDYYVKEVAENAMLHISVDDAQAWHEHVAAAQTSALSRARHICPRSDRRVVAFMPVGSLAATRVFRNPVRSTST
jgi:hypothetical protein